MTTPLMSITMVQALGFNMQGNSSVCWGCSWRSCHGLFTDPSLETLYMPRITLIKSGTLCPYRYHHPFATLLLMKSMVQALVFENQGNSWACLKCSLWTYGGLWGDLTLLDVVNDLHNTHKMLGYHIHNCVLIHGQLHHWWGPWLKLLIPISRVTVEYVLGLVGGHDMVCGVIHPCQTLSMPHIILIKWLHSISITVSSSLHHYTTGTEHDSFSLFQYPG